MGKQTRVCLCVYIYTHMYVHRQALPIGKEMEGMGLYVYLCLDPPPKLPNQVRLNGEGWRKRLMINISDIQRPEYKLKDATQIHVPQQGWKHQELRASDSPLPKAT